MSAQTIWLSASILSINTQSSILPNKQWSQMLGGLEMSSASGLRKTALLLFATLFLCFHILPEAEARRKNRRYDNSGRYSDYRNENCDDILVERLFRKNARNNDGDYFNERERYDSRRNDRDHRRNDRGRRNGQRPQRQQEPSRYTDQSESYSSSSFGDIRDQLHTEMMRNHRVVLAYGEAREQIMQVLDIRQDAQGLYVWDYYCQRPFRIRSSGEMPDSNQLNIEHTWPQSRFNKSLSRDQQRSDMHHLFPTNSWANQLRGHMDFGIVEQDTDYADKNCKDSRVGHGPGNGEIRFQPPAVHRGNVARAVFYFVVHYKLKLTPEHEAILRQWHKDDPVSPDEIERNNKIEKIQGNRNPFIDNPGLVDQIPNFR